MVQQYLDISWVIFSWLELALQVKVGKVASFVGKIFVVRVSTMNICPPKITGGYTVDNFSADGCKHTVRDLGHS